MFLIPLPSSSTLPTSSLSFFLLPPCFHSSSSREPSSLLVGNCTQNDSISEDNGKEMIPTSPSASNSSSGKGERRGMGFGKESEGKKGRKSAVIRRFPAEKPNVFGEGREVKEEKVSNQESLFLLGWLGLGVLIFVEGIALASSGFLPEEWDALLVKYLYPAFTPTVALFFASTVTYGVSKYLKANQKAS